MSLLNIALTGLGVAQTSLTTTSNNITNANTEGYSRQRTEQATRPSEFTGGGYIGNGAYIVGIDRIYNDFINEELRLAGQELKENEAYLSQAEQMDSLLASTSTSLTSSLERFFGSLSTAAEDPQSNAARQLVLSEASSVANRYNVLYQETVEQNSYVNAQIKTLTEEINHLAITVASLNDAIGSAFSNGRQPNELLDQRELAIRDLSELVGITTAEQSNGEINIFVGSGQALVVGVEVSEMSAQASLDAGFQTAIYQPPSGTDLTTVIGGGELGGLLAYQKDLVLPVLNELGRLALVTAQSINDLQAQGLDAEGNFGEIVFGDFNDGFNMRSRSTPDNDNTGNAIFQVEITDAGMLTGSDYTLRVNGGNYEVFSISQNQAVASGTTPIGGTISLPDLGIDIHVESGAVQDGDAFYLSPSRRAADQIEVVLNEPAQLAFSAPVRATSSLNNRGDTNITQPTVTSTINDNNQSIISSSGGFPFDLVYDESAGAWQVTNGPAGFIITPASAAFDSGMTNSLSFTVTDGSGNSVDLELQISGRPQNGDNFTVEFNEDGVADNRNALKMIEIQTADVVRGSAGVNGPNQSLLDTYGQIVEEIGVVTATKKIDTEAYKALYDQAYNAREEVSGVSLDEEAANLIKFEQAYNAATQVISVARDLFDRILQI
ncbi:flagellar hook-associated protein FlgK [Halioxenophilus aromaticivorans]|uniref:Flagellar hook-associated protein 1 n=1 Tax=Halioxenophilus aromaticivorans TaxID=1306992 RepID=A0AAV3TZE7_9ALTE